MPDGPPRHPAAPPDPTTRDIRLPPLPGAPPPAVPAAWAPYLPEPDLPHRDGAAVSAPVPAGDAAVVPDDGAPATGTTAAGARAPGAPREEPTDRITVAGRHPHRRTLSFAPVPPPPFRVTVGPRRSRTRRWWALLVLLTVLVITGSGVWLLVLVGLR